jgi:hypothetical protein
MSTKAFRVREVEVPAEPLLRGGRYDYADSFEVVLDHPDTHSAEEWVRTALHQAPDALATLIRLVHRHVIRFRLGPAFDDEHIIGWRVVVSSQDVMQMEASGPIVDAVIVARRKSPTVATLTTFLFYRRSAAAKLMLVAIRPVHKRAAYDLMRRAAMAFTAEVPAPVD